MENKMKNSMNKSTNVYNYSNNNILTSPRSSLLNVSSPHQSFYNLNSSFRSCYSQNEIIQSVFEACIIDWFPFLKDDEEDEHKEEKSPFESCKKETQRKNEKTIIKKEVSRLQKYCRGVSSAELPLQKLHKMERNISDLNEDNEDEELFYSSNNIYMKIISDNEINKEEAITDPLLNEMMATEETNIPKDLFQKKEKVNRNAFLYENKEQLLNDKVPLTEGNVPAYTFTKEDESDKGINDRFVSIGELMTKDKIQTANRSIIDSKYRQSSSESRKEKKVGEEKKGNREKQVYSESEKIAERNIVHKEKNQFLQTSRDISHGKDKNDLYERKSMEKNTKDPMEEVRNRQKEKALISPESDTRSITTIIEEIRKEEAKEKSIKAETYGDVYMNICVKVLRTNTDAFFVNCYLNNEQLMNEKKKIKEILKLYDKLFCNHFKFTPNKFYKESLRPLYSYYQNLKQHMEEVKSSKNVFDEKQKRSSSIITSSSSKELDSLSRVNTSKEREANNLLKNNNSFDRSGSDNLSHLLSNTQVKQMLFQIDANKDTSQLEKEYKYIYKDLVKLRNLLAKKKYYKSIIFNYQRKFLQNNNRCVKTYRDIYPIEKEYKLYTQIKKDAMEVIDTINMNYKKHYLNK